jgi:hypothetical protein
VGVPERTQETFDLQEDEQQQKIGKELHHVGKKQECGGNIEETVVTQPFGAIESMKEVNLALEQDQL